MTTSRSPLSALRSQSDGIASALKAAERGERVHAIFAEKIEEARGRPSIRVGVVMDDKVINMDLPWTTIRNLSEVALSEYILRQMRDH